MRFNEIGPDEFQVWTGVSIGELNLLRGDEENQANQGKYQYGGPGDIDVHPIHVSAKSTKSDTTSKEQKSEFKYKANRLSLTTCASPMRGIPHYPRPIRETHGWGCR